MAIGAGTERAVWTPHMPLPGPPPGAAGVTYPPAFTDDRPPDGGEPGSNAASLNKTHMLLNTLRVAMAELHLTDIDDEVLARLERRAKQEDRSVEHLVQEELERALSFSSSEKVTEEASFVQAVERLRATSPEKRVPDVEAVEIEGIPASELLIRDRRRR